MTAADFAALVPWIPACPLLGFLFNGLLGSRMPRRLPGVIASLSVLPAFVLSVVGFVLLRTDPTPVDSPRLWTWFRSAGLEVAIQFRWDGLAAVMCLVVTGVGFLIHLYSRGYMAEERRDERYFAYLNLFTFSMLVLVLAKNLLLLFVGWEGVGLCSYLLIGYWFEDPAKVAAGIKAFVVNRIGDLGFLLATFLAVVTFGTLDLVELGRSPLLSQATPAALTTIALLLLLGATGKSAQIPLFVWLPDAMAGPTPVSALIHAATMVTAGVYLTARLFPLFEAAPGALAVIGILGAATSLYAALCALSERDIKKVLAWSTISQLGYMFIGVGAGAPAAAVFHLVTHAFFKALLFLAAGSIIHALHKQDLAAMGGLRRSMPITSLALMVGALALMGLPPFSGFFSKDEMLATAFVAGDLHLWLAGMVGAILTAFYAARLTLLALASEPRSSGTPHESPPVMTLPLLALAALALLGGWIAPPPLLGGHGGFSAFLGFGPGVHGGSAQTAELVTMLVSILMVILGGGVAWMLHTRGLLLAPFVRFSPGLQHALEHKLWVDEFYSRWIVRPVRDGASLLWLLVDKFLIDGSLSLLALLVGGAGWALKGLQSGGIARYAALMALVTAATVFWLIRAL